MAEAVTLLEAWIKLNTKGPDPAQQREVEKSLETFRLGLASLAIIAAETVKGTADAIKEMVTGLSKLYYEAGRIGSTTERIKAFGQAVEQAGASGPAAIADLEKFSEKFRVNPAFREAIKNLGHLSAEDMKDAQSAYVGLSKVLAVQRQTDPLTYGRSQKFAGFDEATVMAIGRPKFDEANKDALEFFGGKLEEIAKKSVRLNQAWLKVEQHLGTIFSLASGKWMDIETGMLEKFDKFLDEHKELFQKLSDSVASIFFDDKGKFDDTAFGKRVYNTYLGWIHSIDFTKLKNAFVAFANWLTTGWFADKIKSVFGSIGGAVRAAGDAAAAALGIGKTEAPVVEGDEARRVDLGNGTTSILKPDGKRAVVDNDKLGMPQPGMQDYVKKGGYGPFSREQTQGAGQDFNIPGQSGFHDIAGKVRDFNKKKQQRQSDEDGDFSDFIKGTRGDKFVPRHDPRPDEFITHPDIHYDQDPNMPEVRDTSGVLGEKLRSNKIKRYIWNHRVHNILASINAQPRATNNQWTRHDGSKTQDIRVTINSSDPHSAATETARQLAHLQNHTMRDWRRVG